MNYQIDWNNLTENEAQEIADLLVSKFSVLAKCFGSDKQNDVSYLTIFGEYDDNLHADELKTS